MLGISKKKGFDITKDVTDPVSFALVPMPSLTRRVSVTEEVNLTHHHWLALLSLISTDPSEIVAFVKIFFATSVAFLEFTKAPYHVFTNT